MSLSGAAGVQNYKGPRRVERTYKRNLAPVTAEYTQNIMPYEEGFWAQYGRRVLLSSLGFITSMVLWIAYLSPWTSNADAWGLGPTMVFLVPLTPIMGALPIWYWVQYRRMQRILSVDGYDDISDEDEELIEVFE